MASNHIIEATGLYKTFGSVTPARDITVNIDAQSVVGLIGTNGAGKTTFVNMLTGYIKPDRGEIVFRGKRITGLAPRKITGLGIARSFQIPQLFGSQTARENIEIALAISGLSADLANDSLARLGVLEFADMVSGTLPEGVRKLLDIALAMVCKPEVLFPDGITERNAPPFGADVGLQNPVRLIMRLQQAAGADMRQHIEPRQMVVEVDQRQHRGDKQRHGRDDKQPRHDKMPALGPP